MDSRKLTKQRLASLRAACGTGKNVGMLSSSEGVELLDYIEYLEDQLIQANKRRTVQADYESGTATANSQRKV